MKEILYKILWLSDDRLKTRSKVYALFNIILGCLTMAVTVILYVYQLPNITNVVNRLNEVSAALSSEPFGINANSANIESASMLLGACAKLIHSMSIPITVILFTLGFSIFFQGILYLRIHEIINEQHVTKD